MPIRGDQQTIGAHQGRSRQPDQGQREKRTAHGDFLRRREELRDPKSRGLRSCSVSTRRQSKPRYSASTGGTFLMFQEPRRFAGQPPCLSTHLIAFKYHQAGTMSAAPAEYRRSRNPAKTKQPGNPH